jgi:long-chain acyl-CoA synthetase
MKQKINLGQIEKILASIIRQKKLIDNPNTNTFFDFVSSTENAKSFAGTVNTDQLFALGKLLNENGSTEQIHEFLDIFRHSSFLTRIYEEDRWAQLILDLIQRSNFTFCTLFNQRLRKYADKILFTVMEPGSQKDYTWQQTGEMVQKYARLLLALLGPGPELKSVAFLCKNSLDMALLDLACLTTGIENVMIPANSVQMHIEYILNYTKPKVLIVSDMELLNNILPLFAKFNFLESILLLKNGNQHSEGVYTLDQVQDLIDSVDLNMIQKYADLKNVQDRATIMFTSGTTGNPKGIMFSYQNIVFKRFARAMAIPRIGEDDVYLSYLPLYHTFGRWLELTGSVFWCARYVFMENPSAEAMLDNMKRIRPSIFISIPKKWYQLYERVQSEVDIFKDDEETIKTAVKKLTGGRLQWGLSAAGHLDVEVFEFFQRNGIELMSGFGMTEATGGITMTPPGGYRPNSLGKALPGVELKFLDDGELLIRGPYVMMGYVNPEESETNMEDGWLATGDIMKVDADSYIRIIDRKKEIYKNIKGETIAPQKIENFFLEMEFIKSVFLVGDHKPFNTLLFFPNYGSQEVDFTQMDESELRSYFSSVIVSVNQFLSPFERVVDFRIIDRDFDLDKNELTAKGTFKRKNIEKNFKDIIEQMYRHEFFPVHVKNYEVQIPTWFLRESGVTQSEVKFKDDYLALKGNAAKLKIVIKKPGIQLGDFVYKTERRRLNLGAIFQSPDLWLGNQSLVSFTGNDIFKWSRSDERDDKIRVAVVLPDPGVLVSELQENDDDLQLLHNSARMLYSYDRNEQEKSIEYLGALCKSSQSHLAFFANEILYRTIFEKNQSLQEMTIPVMIDTLHKEEFQKLLTELFDRPDFEFSESLISAISEKRLSDENLNVLFESIKRYCITADKSCEKLFELVSVYGTSHPAQYKNIRQFLINSQLNAFHKEISEFAGTAYDKLKSGFRDWLGTKQTVAVDMETGEEYTWDNVLTFEEGTDPDDRNRLYQAITRSTIIREAVFLFSKGALVRLHDIPPGGVWVSLLGSDHGKSVYRVTVQTRYQGSFDLAVNINHKLKVPEVVEEIKWLMQTGSISGDEQLVEEFGGYWPEYNLWSEEYVQGETAGKFLKRIARQQKDEILDRILLLWPFFIWSATTGYLKFWMRTGQTMEIKDPSPNNIIVPVHDYQTGSRIVSISARQQHQDILSLIRNIFEKFVTNSEDEHAVLKGIGKYKYIFSGVIEAIGIEHGLRILKECLEICRLDKKKQELKILSNELSEYIENVEEFGFLPKKLYFAIKRYHRWYALTSDPTIAARAETLSELYNTYQLHNLEIENPETRIRFFKATVFSESSEDLLVRLEKIIRGQRVGNISQDNLSQYISAIQTELKLSEDELFFLTRLTYPHLSPTDSADLITMEAGGVSDLDVVVRLQDYDGDEFSVRTPVNPKEITRLHQLFLKNNLAVYFSAEHRYLIAINERSHLIGGLFYSLMDEKTAHIEKIVVTNSYRKKGVSDGLLNEFFKRMKSDHRSYVTTGFFRPEYFYRFGFKTERKYAGLVRKL